MFSGVFLVCLGMVSALDEPPDPSLPSPSSVPSEDLLVGAVPPDAWITPPTEELVSPDTQLTKNVTVELAAGTSVPRYRSQQSSSSWVVGDGDQFGMVSFVTDHYLQGDESFGINTGFSFHLLSGPERTDLPPRIYDVAFGLQNRKWIDRFGYDVAAAVKVSTDFEGSSREGVRFPGHAVGFVMLSDALTLVLGAEYLDRDDVRVLPVGGLIFQPNPDLRFELVFPVPRCEIQLSESHALYLSGGLGGGTWAVERDSWEDDLLTYRDLRLCLGLETIGEEGNRSAIEFGWLFDRRIDFATDFGDYAPGDTLMIRSVSSY